jgi:quinol monooxygenase YgiN
MKTVIKQIRGNLSESAIRIKEIELDEANLMEHSGEIGRWIAEVWRDPEIQEIWEHRSSFYVGDTADYFFSRAEKIFNEDEKYVPTFKDVILCNIRTCGVNEVKFKANGQRFLITDVGGQRSERRKWKVCYDDVTAILYAASLIEYDQVLFEDNTEQRLDESLNVFSEILKVEKLRYCPIILVLTKKDLFEKKIKQIPLSNSCTNYNGDSDYQSCLKFIIGLYMDRVPEDRKKNVIPYVIDATDSEAVKNFFESMILSRISNIEALNSRSRKITLRFKKECHKLGRQALLKYQAITRNKHGCVACDVWLDKNTSDLAENELIYVLFEKWKDQNSLDQHALTEYSSELRYALSEYCEFMEDSQFRFVQ